MRLKGLIKLLICLKVFMIYNSCGLFEENQKVKSQEFDSYSFINHEEIIIDDIIMHPLEIAILNDAIILKDIKSDYHFHFFCPDTYSYLNSFVRKGRGPNEEIMIQKIYSLDKNFLIYRTVDGLKKIKYDVENQDIIFEEEYDVPIDQLVYAFPLSEERILGWNRDSHENEFLIYNPLKEEYTDFGSGFPNHGKNLSLTENHRLHSNKQITVNKERSKFAASYMVFPMIRIFETTKCKLIKEFRLNNDFGFPNARINRNATQKAINNLYENYYTIQSTDKYIYALFSGITKGELYKDIDLSSPTWDATHFGQEIHIWDWEGNPVQRLVLDKMIISFDVCSKDEKLIAFSLNNPDMLYLYLLP